MGTLPAVLITGLLLLVAISLINGQEVKRSLQDDVEEQDFDGIAYIDMNPDLQTSVADASAAWMHYYFFGKMENRKFPRKLPEQQSLEIADRSIRSFVKDLAKRAVPLNDCTLVMYYLPAVEGRSVEALLNSVKIFASAVQSDSASSSNFYWINTIQAESNPFVRYFPTSDNVAVASWALPVDQGLLTLRTLDHLERADILPSFGSVMFLDADTRGPFTYREEGDWLAMYRDLLRPHHIGLAGSSFSCELTPHVQNHSYIVRSSVVPIMLQAFNMSGPYGQFRATMRFNLQYLSVIVRRYYNITSMLHQQHTQEPYFQSGCMSYNRLTNTMSTVHNSGYHSAGNTALLNPLHWCSVDFQKLIFYPWGGDRLEQTCRHTKQQMYQALLKLNRNEPSPQLQAPETLRGGMLHDLQLQYEHEMLTHHRSSGSGGADTEGKARQARRQVCVIVRGLPSLHLLNARITPNVSLSDRDYFHSYHHFIQSMFRQTDPNWMAFFYLLDDHQAFAPQLKQLLEGYTDPRLRFIGKSRRYRARNKTAALSTNNADFVLQRVLQQPNCKYISFSTGNNIYGSNVVESVQSAVARQADVYSSATGSKQPLTAAQRAYNALTSSNLKADPVKMIVLPVDSKMYLYKEHAARDYKPSAEGACTSLIVSFHVNVLGTSPSPATSMFSFSLSCRLSDSFQRPL